MTCIVDPNRFPTKKSLKLEAAANPELVSIYDPSIFNERTFRLPELKLGEEVVVTNHPKRSWFAQVGRTKEGKLYVK